MGECYCCANCAPRPCDGIFLSGMCDHACYCGDLESGGFDDMGEEPRDDD